MWKQQLRGLMLWMWAQEGRGSEAQVQVNPHRKQHHHRRRNRRIRLLTIRLPSSLDIKIQMLNEYKPNSIANDRKVLQASGNSFPPHLLLHLPTPLWEP